jgi:RHS repeat-associated protein
MVPYPKRWNQASSGPGRHFSVRFYRWQLHRIQHSDQILRYKNGVSVQYAPVPSGAPLFRPTQIKDANGNFISITYVSGHDQFINQITDTLGRIITFDYMPDGSGRLQDIKQSLYPSGSKTYVTFTWGNIYGNSQLWYKFSGLTVSGAPNISNSLNVLTGCTYANGTGYRFTYGDWAIINKIENLSKPAPGNSTGLTRSYIQYDYPPVSAVGTGLTDAPTFAHQTISPDGTANNTSVWTYATTKDSTGAVTKMDVTDPNGNISTTNLDPSTGLTSSIVLKDGSDRTLRTTSYTWIFAGLATVPGTIQTTNDNGQVSKDVYSYDTNGNVTDSKEYDFSGALVRETATTFAHTQFLVEAHILNLRTQVKVLDGANNEMARTTFGYDENSLTLVSGAAGHDDSGYGSGFNTRGNLTSLTRCSVVLPAGSCVASVTRNFYFDTLGNLIKAQLDCCNQKKFNFASGTQYAYPDSVVRGPDGGTQYTTSAIYDFNFGLVLTATDENNQVTQHQYDSMNRLTQVTLPPQQGTYVHLNTAYGDDVASPTVTSSNSVNSAVGVTTLDGLGHVMQKDINGTPASRVTYAYDKLWQRTQVSNPYTPGDPVINTTLGYDGLGRVVQVSPHSGGNTQYQYVGNSVTVIDAAGKPRKSFFDALGRLVEVDEPGESFDGKASGSMAVSGTLQSTVAGGQSATQATGSVDIAGSEQSTTVGGGPYCAMWNNTGDCVDWETDPGVTIYDAGTVRITVNGHPDTYSYGQFSSDIGIASGLAALINGDSSAFVTASPSGATVRLTSKAYGNATNYSLSSSYTYDSADFGTPSFTTRNSGSALTGGHDAVNGTTVYDAGTVTVTIGSFLTSVTYGQNTNNTSATVASALVSGLNASNSPVTAYATGSGITITYKTAGAAGNVAVSCNSSTSQGTYFTSPSFTCPGITLTGGQAPYSSGFTHPYSTTYTYDVMNNLTGVSQAAGLVNGQQAAGQQRSYQYDSLGRLGSATTPESGTVYTWYADVNNNPCSGDTSLPCRVQDARGIIRTLSYDTLNRPLTVTYSDGTPSVTYQYDNGGAAAYALTRMTKITEGANSQTFTYDNLGRLKAVSQVIDGTTYLIQYNYNLASQVTSVTYPSGRVVSQNVDAFGTMASISDTSATYLSNLTYNAAKQTLGFTMGNGVQGAFTYNDHLQLSTLHYFKSGSPTTEILNLAYDYGTTNNGQIQAVHYYSAPNVEDLTKSEIFTYDLVGRLSAAQTSAVNSTSGSKTWSLQWAYDRLGNRKSQTLVGGDPSLTVGQPNFTIDTNTSRIVGYCYDAAGNLQDETSCPTGTHQYTYDGANRLKQINTGPAYTYFGAQRIKKINSGTTTIYVYAGNQPIAEYVNGNSTPAKEYVYAGSQLLATMAGSSTTYHHPDHLSSRTETDSLGTPIRTFGHFPFGETWYETGAAEKWKFTTYERDSATGETGLDYAMFRNYESAASRFVSADPAPGTLGAPQSLNRYSYAGNDPVNSADPLGLWTVNWSCNFYMSRISDDGGKTWALLWAGGGCTFKFMPDSEQAGGGGGGGGRTSTGLTDSILNNRDLLQRINDCLHLLLGQSFSKYGELTSATAPAVDGSLTSEEIQTKFAMSAPPYATGVGDEGGPHGTIFIGKKFFDDPTQWVAGRPDLPGRSPIENAYVHEIGNLASFYGTKGTTKWGYDMFGISSDSDGDSGYQLQLCVFPAVPGFSSRPFNGPI